MTILVTGAAGFIGCDLALNLCRRGEDVIGIDNLNDYYDVDLKRARSRASAVTNFVCSDLDLADGEGAGFLIRISNDRSCIAHGGAGGCTLFAGESARLRR